MLVGVGKKYVFEMTKVSYRVYLKNGESYYRQAYYGAPVDKDPVEFLTAYLSKDWKELMNHETGQVIDYYKIISIGGIKVNVEVRR